MVMSLWISQEYYSLSPSIQMYSAMIFPVNGQEMANASSVRLVIASPALHITHPSAQGPCTEPRGLERVKKACVSLKVSREGVVSPLAIAVGSSSTIDRLDPLAHDCNTHSPGFLRNGTAMLMRVFDYLLEQRGAI